LQYIFFSDDVHTRLDLLKYYKFADVTLYARSAVQ
jgi:hypothetical protein